MPFPLIPVLEIGARILDKVIPDPQAKAAAQLELMRLQQEGSLRELDADVQLAVGQLEVNKAEAASGSAFASGWRPSVGWICAAGLGYQMVARPILEWLTVNTWQGIPPPGLELDTLLTLLFGMLGLGALRTGEKIKGVAK